MIRTDTIVVIECDANGCHAEYYGDDDSPGEVRCAASDAFWVRDSSGDYCPDHADLPAEKDVQS